jgi:hypothetical protein
VWVAVLTELWRLERLGVKKLIFLKKIKHCELGGWRWDGEWQWQFDSGVVGQRRSRRFEWWWLERGSGSIESVESVSSLRERKIEKKRKKKKTMMMKKAPKSPLKHLKTPPKHPKSLIKASKSLIKH